MPRAAPVDSVSDTGLDRQTVDDGLERDQMAAELELGVLEARCDADQLREVENRHLELAPRLLAELRLPGVEREMAQGAWSHDGVRASLGGLLDRLDQLRERDVLARLDDREAAALDLRRIVDRLPAARVDDPLERLRPVRVLEAEDLGRAQDLAAVEGRDAQPLQALVSRLFQQLVAVASGHEPEEVLDVDAAGVRGRAH